MREGLYNPTGISSLLKFISVLFVHDLIDYSISVHDHQNKKSIKQLNSYEEWPFITEHKNLVKIETCLVNKRKE